jgi:hypothetical protein
MVGSGQQPAARARENSDQIRAGSSASAVDQELCAGRNDAPVFPKFYAPVVMIERRD